MGPTRASMDASVKSLYLRQPDSQRVLKMHALSHFTTPLASQRLGLALMPADLMQEARAMQAQEEAFATAWIAAVKLLSCCALQHAPWSWSPIQR